MSAEEWTMPGEQAEAVTPTAALAPTAALVGTNFTARIIPDSDRMSQAEGVVIEFANGITLKLNSDSRGVTITTYGKAAELEDNERLDHARDTRLPYEGDGRYIRLLIKR